jgi:hypothetical protein
MSKFSSMANDIIIWSVRWLEPAVRRDHPRTGSYRRPWRRCDFDSRNGAQRFALKLRHEQDGTIVRIISRRPLIAEPAQPLLPGDWPSEGR